MLLVEKNDLHLFTILALFFATEITSGSIQLLLLGVLLLLSVFYALSYSENLWIILFFLVLFQKGLQRISDGTVYQLVTYIDEFVELVVLGYLIYSVFKNGLILSKNERRIVITYVGYLFFCFFSSVGSAYASISTIVLDCFVCMKFMIFYRGGVELARNGKFTTEDIYYRLNKPCRYTSVLLLILTLHDIFLPAFFEKFDYRYFTESIELCFLHPTYLAAVCLTCMAVLMCGMQYEKGNFKYILFLGIVTILTFRSKAIVSVVIIFVIYFAYVKLRLQLKGLLLAAAGCFGVYFGLDQVEKYFTVGSSVPIRLKLLQDGASIASSHFPLGAGFGSFGTTVAYESNSVLYSQFGYMSGYYLNQPVGDGFWCGIFAESGWIGTVFFVLCIIFMLIEALNKIRYNRFSGWCMLSIIIYAIIASTAETAFFNPATAFMFLIYGIASTAEEDISDLEINNNCN